MQALSPLDDRYKDLLNELREVFCEKGLVKKRLEVEIEYLILFCESIGVRLTAFKKKQIRKIDNSFDSREFAEYKKIEKRINHDVKAVEYYLQKKLLQIGLKRLKPWIHFGLTSEDVNNLAQTLQLKKASNIILNQANGVRKILIDLIRKGKDSVMLARTHGQPALPTTMGKELLVFVVQIDEILKDLRSFEYRGKMMGAVGTLAAHRYGFKEIDWLAFSKKFVTSFGLKAEMVNTQVLLPISWMKLFCVYNALALVIEGLARDLWLYVSFEYFKQKVVKGEVGSSTMPQKVNPIRLENAEGNAQIAGNEFSFFIKKFSYSRLQRDLSDSTVKRNIGVAFGHLYLSLNSIEQGLSRLKIDNKKLIEEIEARPEIMAEAEQIDLRIKGVGQAFEKTKSKYRGKKIELDRIDVAGYLGFAKEIVSKYLKKVKQSV